MTSQLLNGVFILLKSLLFTWAPTHIYFCRFWTFMLTIADIQCFNTPVWRAARCQYPKLFNHGTYYCL